MPICCVYILFNIEGFYYIGQTTNLKRRLSEHKWNFKNRQDCSSIKLGEDWDYEILEECAEEDLCEAERFYYDFYQEIDSEHCVNFEVPMRTKAEYNAQHSNERYDKLKQWRINNPEKLMGQRLRYRARRKAISI